MRDPKQLFARYGRQLLVAGADFAGQERLHGWTAVLAADASPFAQAAAEACGRYLVGAGVGSVVAPSAQAQDLVALDPLLQVLAGPDAAQPPVAHYWFVSRPDGASIDVVLTDAGVVRAALLSLQIGAPAEADFAVLAGAAAAELLLADVFRLEALPARVTMDWRDPLLPQVTKQLQQPARPTGLLAAMRAAPAVWQPLVAEAVRGYPLETCGLIVRCRDGELKTIVCANLQDRYHALDPLEFPRTARTAYKFNERVIGQAAAVGETLVAIWHTHCDAAAYFSAEDARCAVVDGEPLYPDVGYVVLSVMAGEVTAAELYRLDSGTGGFIAESGPS